MIQKYSLLCLWITFVYFVLFVVVFWVHLTLVWARGFKIQGSGKKAFKEPRDFLYICSSCQLIFSKRSISGSANSVNLPSGQWTLSDNGPGRWCPESEKEPPLPSLLWYVDWNSSCLNQSIQWCILTEWNHIASYRFQAVVMVSHSCGLWILYNRIIMVRVWIKSHPDE